MTKTRLHPLALLHDRDVALGLAAAWMWMVSTNVIVWAIGLGIHQHDPLAGPVLFLHAHARAIALVFLGLAALDVLVGLANWSISYIEIDEGTVRYRIGYFVSNDIPLRAIQRCYAVRPTLGLLFGYGTLVLDAGRSEETLFFVPDVDDIRARIEAAWR